MRIARSLGCLMLAAALAVALGGCWSGIYENPAAQYVARSDTVTLSAGNAKDVNAATHVIDPWPRNVKDRRISGNGERMVGAVQRYQRPQAGRTSGQGQARPGVNPGEIPGGAAVGGAPGTITPTATLPF
jgi:hypothetical protein